MMWKCENSQQAVISNGRSEKSNRITSDKTATYYSGQSNRLQ